jgi:hypothetical protein
MRDSRGSRRIVVRDVEYRWRATGDDGYISVGIWPTNNVGPYIRGNLRYDETWVKNDDGSRTSRRDQIVVTNRIVRRIIEHAIVNHRYDPMRKGGVLNLKVLDEVIRRDDAVRAPARGNQVGANGGPGI